LVADARLQPQERESLRQRVYEELRRAVLAGHFAPGQRMTIRALAAELGTSPTPVRDALGRLHAERVLELRASGAAVMPVFTKGRLKHITAVRVALEGLAAAEAAANAKANDIAALEGTMKRLTALAGARDYTTYLELHRDFHFQLYRCSGNTLLVELIEDLWTQCGPVLAYVLPDYVQRGIGHAEHRNAVDAISRADGVAARDAIVRDIRAAAAYIESLANVDGEIRR
jgi:DNA-binding GntR family transcriptional regulator